MSYASEVLADAPVVYYRMNDTSGTAAVDSSGHGQNGVYSGTPTFLYDGATSDHDKAIGFNGIDTMLATPELHALFTGASVTLEAWVKRGPSGGMVFTERGSAGWADEQMEIETDGRCLSRVWSTSGLVMGTILDDLYHHLVQTYSGPSTEIRTYLDAVLGETRIFTRLVPTDAHATDTPPTNIFYEIGSTSQGGTSLGNGIPYTGAIDEVAVYATALAPERVLAHYRAALTDRRSPVGAA